MFAVGAAISRPPSQSRLRRASSPKGGAKNTPSTLPLRLPLGEGGMALAVTDEGNAIDI